MTSYILETKPWDPSSNTLVSANMSNGIADEAALGQAAPYPLRLNRNFTYDISVFEGNLPGAAQVSVGSITLNNVDGRLDYLLNYVWGGKEVVLKSAPEGSPYAAYTEIFRGSAIEISGTSSELTLTLRDNSWKLVTPLQKNKYLGTGDAEGGKEILGQFKPLCFGLVKNATPVLVNSVYQTYQVHDGGVEAFIGAYDDAIPLSYTQDYPNYAALTAAKVGRGGFATCLAEGFIRLGAPPAGALTVDVQGQFYSHTTLSETIRQILLARSPLTSADLQTSDFAEFASDFPGRVSGIYYRIPDEDLTDTLDTLLGTGNAFWFFGSDGKLRVRQFKFRTPTATVRTEDIKALQRSVSAKPIYAVTVNFDRNMTIQETDSLTLAANSLNAFLDDEILYVQTAANGTGGDWSSVTTTMRAYLGNTEVNSLRVVDFQEATPKDWLTINPEGLVTITNPGSNEASADLRVSLNNYYVTVPLTVKKILGSSGAWLKLNANSRVFNLNSDNSPSTPNQSITLTAEGNFTSLTWSAVDNAGKDVPLQGTGTSRSISINSLQLTDTSSSVLVKVVSANGATATKRLLIARKEATLADIALDWSDIVDDGKKPADNADVTGENTSKDTQAVAGTPATQLVADTLANKTSIVQAQQDIEGLVTTYGSTASAAESANAAQTAQTAAESARDLARGARDASVSAMELASGYRDQSSLFKEGADAAKAAADSAKLASETARNQSQGARDAAQTAQSLSESARDAALISKNDAAAYAENASQSSTTAQGFSSSASQSAGVAASSSQSAILTTANGPILPSDFYNEGRYWAKGSHGFPNRTSLEQEPDGAYTFPVIPGIGKVLQITAGSNKSINPLGWLFTAPGKRFRIHVRHRLISGQASVRAYISYQTAEGTDAGSYGEVQTSTAEWRDFIRETTSDGPSNAAYIRPIIRIEPASNAEVQISIISILDITSELAAAGSASAAAGYASTASSEAGIANQKASAASASANDAATEAGRAASFATQASTSEINALGSANSAAQSLGVSTQLAAGSLPSDFVQEGLFWSASWTGEPTRASLVGDSRFSFPVIAGQGKVLQLAPRSSSVDVAPLSQMIASPGRSQKATLRVRTLSGTSTARLYIGGLQSNFSSSSDAVFKDLNLNSTWQDVDLLRTSDPASGTAYLRPMIRLDGNTVSAIQVAYLKFEDVTESRAAFSFANTAATSAGAAGTSASAAGEAKTLAETAKGLAETYANNAATSASNADGSAQTATQASGVAVSSRDAAAYSAGQAQGHASAAAEQASTATQKATAAGLSATAANDARLLAETAQGRAQTSATNAATSETNALGSANAASQSQSVAASSANNALLTVANGPVLPSDFSEDGRYWATTNSLPTRPSLATTPNAAYTFTTVTGIGRVLQISGSGNRSVAPLGWLSYVPGRRLRYEVRHRLVSGTSNIRMYRAHLTEVGGDAGSSSAVQTCTEAWQTLTVETTADPSASTVYTRPVVRVEASTADAVVQISMISIQDVTSEKAASGFANAASTSATTANTRAGEASSSATAANNAKTAAETARGLAQGYATNAATSETNALGSANAASTSAGVAATSANTANLSAAKSFPDRYDTSGKYFTTATGGSPESVVDAPSTATVSGYGPVREVTLGQNATQLWATRQVLAATAGRIYRVDVEFQQTASSGSSASVNLNLYSLDSSYASIGGLTLTPTTPDGTVQVISRFFSSSADASAGILAWRSPTTASWLRPVVSVQTPNVAGSSATIQLRRLSVIDVTDSVSASKSASASAGSASTASSKAGEASSSAEAASAAKTLAETARGQAQGFASNAASSAETATTQASSASSSAGLAAGSANTAGEKANAASESATTAGAKADEASLSAGAAESSRLAANTERGLAESARDAAVIAKNSAEGSATTATTQATLAATARDQAQSVANSLIPSNLGQRQNFVIPHNPSPSSPDTAPVPSAGTIVTGIAGEGDVLELKARNYVGTRGWMAVGSGKNFRADYRYRTTVNGSGNAVRLGFFIYDASGGYLGTVNWTYTTTGSTVTEGWVTQNRETNSSAILAAHSTAAFIRAGFYGPSTTGNGSSGATMQFSTMTLVENSAEKFAVASSSSAAAAAGSVTAAGAQAEIARQHKEAAIAANGTAQGAATNAQSYATQADSSRALASSSATLASSFSAQALNRDPYFADPAWTSAAVPPSWAIWQNDGSAYIGKWTGDTGNLYSGRAALRIARSVNGNNGIVQTVSIAGYGWYVLEADVTSNSGNWTGAGVYVTDSGTPVQEGRLNFGTDPDLAKVVVSGAAGRNRKFSKMIYFATAPANGTVALHAMSGWTGFAPATNAGNFIWHKCQIRPATRAEMDGQDALAATVTQGATISQQAQTISTLNTDVATLKTTVSSQGTTISQQATTISTLNSDVGTLKTTVSSQGTLITNTQNSLSSIDTRLASVETSVTSYGPNLIPNGGFENSLRGWTTGQTGTGAVTFSHQSGNGWGDFASLNSPGSVTNGGVFYFQPVAISIEADQTYTLAADVNLEATANGSRCYLEIIFLNSSMSEINRVTGPSMQAPRRFSQTGVNRSQKVTGTAPSNAVYALARITVQKTSGSIANFSVRQVKLEKGSTASVYSSEATVSQSFQSINGLFARAAVRLDVNGYVSGWEANNNGSQGNFVINADNFEIRKPAGGPRTEYSNGVWRVYAGAMLSAWGAGFGSSNQFVRWFGPAGASLADCREDNAIEYLRTDGSAYFGGALSTGQFRNSITGSLTTDPADTDLGPFGTNGGHKNVNVSAFYSQVQSGFTSGPIRDGGAAQPSFRLTLFRSRDGSNWTQIAQQSFTGNWSVQPAEPGSPGSYSVNCSGSFTFLDQGAGGAEPLYYRARIDQRSLPTFSGSGAGAPIVTQRATIISTEG